MQRTLHPEILDSLPPDHPDALRNRRDLKLTNLVMGNHRWFARTLPPRLLPGEHVLEIGSGVGDLGRRLHQLNVAADGLDLWPRPADWPPPRAWHRGDLCRFDRYGDYGAVIGNLIFHQFSSSDLSTLGRKLGSSTRVILACEPARRRQTQRLFTLFARLIGANHVTLHDGNVSIAAGFMGDELPEALELDRDRWDCRCTITTLGAYRMIAIRRP